MLVTKETLRKLVKEELLKIKEVESKYDRELASDRAAMQKPGKKLVLQYNGQVYETPFTKNSFDSKEYNIHYKSASGKDITKRVKLKEIVQKHVNSYKNDREGNSRVVTRSTPIGIRLQLLDQEGVMYLPLFLKQEYVEGYSKLPLSELTRSDIRFEPAKAKEEPQSQPEV